MRDSSVRQGYEIIAGRNFGIYNLRNKHRKKNSKSTPLERDKYINPLQELRKSVEESGNTSDSNAGTVGNSSTRASAGGSTRAAGAGAGRSAGFTSGGGGVVGLGVAVVFTLDDVAAEVVEVAAAEVTVGALEVEATLNIVQVVQVNTEMFIC